MIQHINLYYPIRDNIFQTVNNQRMSNNNSYSEQIERLSEQLEQLQIDFTTQSNRINNSIKRLERKISENKKDETSFELGNHVEIINNYKGLQGTRGYVIKITKKQVVIRDESNHRTHTRSKSNVKKVVA